MTLRASSGWPSEAAGTMVPLVTSTQPGYTLLRGQGAIVVEDFRREHRREYDRLAASGELQKYLVDAPSQPMTAGSKILGFTLIGVGLLLLILVLVGFLGHAG